MSYDLRLFPKIYQLCRNWFLLSCHKLVGFPVGEIRLRKGIVFKTNLGKIGPADLAMLTESWCEQCYTPAFLAICPGDVVFDIGSNNGYFAVLAATLAKSGRIYAFEPVPALAALIRVNARANGLANIEVENVAVSE